MAEKWQKRSSPPSSGVMKPKPFLASKNFVVPVAIMNGPLCFDGIRITPLGAVKALPPQIRVESMICTAAKEASGRTVELASGGETAEAASCVHAFHGFI